MSRMMWACLLTLAAAPAAETPDVTDAGVAEAATAQRQTVTDTTTRTSGAADRESVTITVYNQNFGLVREIRTLDLGRGLLGLEFGDVASSIQPETVHIRSLSDGGRLTVLEQNYRYDLLNPQKLLEKYVGRTVKVHVWNQEEKRDEVKEAEVLSVNGGPILRIDDEITYNVPGRLSFPEVPDDLIASPTLVWLLDSGMDRQRVEASYLTGGLNWKSDYVMVLDEDDEHAGITGWVTLTNQSGATYEDATLKLVAGDVQRVGRNEMMRRAQVMEAAAADATGFAEEAFFEYHLYTLGRPTTVRQNEQKQVSLLESPSFGLEKRLIFYGAAQYYRGSYGQVVSNQKVGVYLDFENAEKNGLGMPLPAGVVRVYKRDASGAQQFVGEDRIDHTPRGETVSIKMGEAFDVVGDRRQTDYEVLGSCVSESSWEISLRNHKDEAAVVEVVEPVGGDWEVVSASRAAKKLDAHTFKFEIKVPARGEEKITYRVRVRWC
ncbi:MAG: hypothetical protein PVF05_06970 [Gemmatimonadales bacterium]